MPHVDSVVLETKCSIIINSWIFRRPLSKEVKTVFALDDFLLKISCFYIPKNNFNQSDTSFFKIAYNKEPHRSETH